MGMLSKSGLYAIRVRESPFLFFCRKARDSTPYDPSFDGGGCRKCFQASRNGMLAGAPAGLASLES